MDKLETLMEKHQLTPSELELIIKNSKKYINNEETKKLNIGSKKFYYAYFSDSHIGHKEFKPQVYEQMLRLITKYKPDFVFNMGDTLEGMSNRPGHIYELSHIGFSQQFNYAKELLSQIEIPIYGIDGNHDGWYEQKSNIGIIVGEELQRTIPNYNNLGQMEGDLNIDGIQIKLFHGNDGSAYATSYKLQKLIESFSGGEKPQIVHSGHYHKSLYMFLRNVHGLESGTLCGQSKFMRGKKLQAHVGFGFIKVYHDGKSITRFNHEFVPYY
jgi:DNA polymerase II small subunit/DNA polymerase delta subunit B